jgi:O-succinylbenzoic acid--CoA ligase
VKLDNWLSQRALTGPDRTALVADGAETGYAELEAEATWVARRLAAYGVRRGGIAALTMRPGREQVVLIHALMKLGAVLLPLSTRLPEEERRAVLAAEEPAIDLSDAAAQLTQTEADLPLLGEHDMDEVHCRILTSGSSGAPRAVPLTYGNHLFSAVGSAFNIGVQPEDRWLCCLPLSHVSGLSIVMRSVIYGTGMVLQDGFDVDAVAGSLERDRVTLLSVVSTMLVRLLDAGIDLSGPRAVLVGGGPVPADTLEEALGRGATVVQTYGLTEACSQVTTLAPEDARRKLGSAGRPLLTTHLRIQDGEILVQGPTVAPDCADAEGWLHTGDIGRIDEEGFLFVEDRIDDMIVSGGENVVPAEVEGVLLRHPAVADAAVVGREDPEWQQAVTAVVVLRGGSEASADELRRHCAEALAPFKVPKRIELASALPRTPSGKLMRRALR